MEKDEYFTPREIVKKIYDKIKIERYKYIWLPFDERNSQFFQEGIERGMAVFNTHINDGIDFFKFTYNNIDLLISNPPFSCQFEVIERCFNLIDGKHIKSFCLLLPLSVLETEKRANLLERYSDKISIVIFKKRIKFIGQKQVFDRACCLVCYNIKDLPRLSWI